jgi:hypothetical protein
MAEVGKRIKNLKRVFDFTPNHAQQIIDSLIFGFMM